MSAPEGEAVQQPGKAVSRRRPAAPAPTGEAAVMTMEPGSIVALLSKALDDGVSLEKLEKMTQLYERLGDRAAAMEFNGALSRFQTTCPPIPKTSTAKIATRSGSNFEYAYAEIDQIARVINPLLGKEGLAYSWDSVIEGQTLKCVCTLRHANGYSTTATFVCPLDAADRMSGPQRHAAALTYARRQSLIQVLGLSTTDSDDDAVKQAETISEDQQVTLKALAEEVKVPMEKVLRTAKVQSVGEILAQHYPRLIKALEARRGAPAGGAQ